MIKLVKVLALVAGTLFAGSAFSTQLVCEVLPNGNGSSYGDGTSYCSAADVSSGFSVSVRFYLINVTKPIQGVRWSGAARCSGGESCTTTIRAYAPLSASALVLYKDGTWERTNTATAVYETGL